MIKELNVLIAGVGGQGVILISELLGEAAIRSNLSIRGSEVLGMAVRGGPVVSIVRFGSKIYSPLIPIGKGDVLIAMELTEALRNINTLSKSSLVVVNTRRIVPYTVSLGISRYPDTEEVLQKLRLAVSQVVTLDAEDLAKKAGSPLSANVVMLGTLLGTGRLPIEIETIKTVIEERFPNQIESNIKAIDLGYKACQKALEGANR